MLRAAIVRSAPVMVWTEPYAAQDRNVVFGLVAVNGGDTDDRLAVAESDYPSVAPPLSGYGPEAGLAGFTMRD